VGACDNGLTVLTESDSGFSLNLLFGKSYFELPAFSVAAPPPLLLLSNEYEVKKTTLYQTKGMVNRDGSVIVVVNNNGRVK
jgi:hypothetical protein